ncbi:hypothetical protein GJ496_010922 [Pomphorhynchus laevis]|nr:hypothetical protein GJ496_010922 [Pomphorhynchus laevis]
MKHERTHLSFSGAGFLGIYHLGVVKAFQDNYPEILDGPIIGTSAGSLTAAAVCCSIPISTCLYESLHMMRLSSELKASLRRMLPKDAYLKCNNRLYVSLTSWRSGNNELVNHFDSNDDLIDALACSSHIPIFSGFLPHKYHGKYYWDGGVSNNCPRLNEYTITVSPFSSPSVDICPHVKKTEAHLIVYSQGLHYHRTIDNLTRLHRTFFPQDPRTAEEVLICGYNNAIEYMLKEGLITMAIPRFINTNRKHYLSIEEKIEGSMSTLPSVFQSVLKFYMSKLESLELENVFGRSSGFVQVAYWFTSRALTVMSSMLINNDQFNDIDEVDSSGVFGKRLVAIMAGLNDDKFDGVKAENYAINDLVVLIRQFEPVELYKTPELLSGNS